MQTSSLNRAWERAERNSFLLAKRVAQRLRVSDGREAAKRVVFVSGVQRSGTNMLMDVLERSFHTDVYHETDARAFADYEMRPHAIIHRLVESSNAACVVIKALCEAQEVRQLLDEFAPAKALWALRDLDDVVNSHVAIWTKMPHNIGVIARDRNAAGWRGRGMSDATHALVSRLYRPDINNASAVALFWYFRNVLFFEQGLDRDPRVRLVRYERLVTDPDREFARLFDFLGIPYTSRVAGKVVAGSVRKAPAPKIEPEIRAICTSLAARFQAVFAAKGATAAPPLVS